MKVGLSVYGTTYMMGLHPKSGQPRITAMQLMQRAVEAGLEGVEMPLQVVEGEDIQTLVRYAEKHRLYVTVASGGYDPDKLETAMDMAVRLGAKTVRTVVGGAHYGGDRRPMAGRWQSFMQEVLAGLAKATATAERKGLQLALENHQDVASEELLWLCEQIGSSHFGITLDTGNPLATAEEPIAFAKRIMPHLKHVHLKDYWIYLTEEGYRLVRCPIGQGAVDFPALLELFAEHHPEMTMSIEVGALEARHTRVWADDYWPEYPPRSAAQLAETMRFVHTHARAQADWRTPHEKNEPERAVIAYENHQLLASIAYMQGLMRTFRGYTPLHDQTEGGWLHAN
ncbi:sugar phosphate isomerase/epimerase family protein [Paenibacillus piri]|uniref:Sugar phosphate isomerase/epimerase n=1 Tax=Paenibacillus piri TaxID=2547395 RepID=A0A4R5KWW2_9BACL|nr:sugar phosphate isomerase/epimerase family protein [Paenibacillus piri]TDF99668.1 sugar phosphate isomerase/epimerase [Paenibacillus piri]